jgi:UDP-N-acetylglucosamine 3-dehydrogenase
VTRLRAGLIGYGMMGRHHARVLMGLEGVDVVGIVDTLVTNECGPRGTPLLSSIDDLVHRGVDYCVVAAPTACHEEIGLALAASGVHALIEKPLAHDSAAARRLAAAFESAGLVGAVGHVERYNAALRAARGRIAIGELGDIYQICTRRQGPYPGRISDVGVIKDLATHDIDLTCWISQQRYDSLTAHSTHRSGRDHEDMVAVVGRLTDQTVTNHVVNWLSPFKERLTVVTGERGTLVADTLTADLTFHSNGSVPTTWPEVRQFRGVSEGDVVRYAIHKPEPLQLEHESMRDAVLGLKANIVGLRDSVATLEVAEAMIESSRHGRTVSLSGAA